MKLFKQRFKLLTTYQFINYLIAESKMDLRTGLLEIFDFIRYSLSVEKGPVNTATHNDNIVLGKVLLQSIFLLNLRIEWIP